MDTHDKDIDQLFRSQLGEMEEQPSARVWKNIAAELGEPAAKRSLAPYLRVAASIVVVLGAGLWLIFNQSQPAGQLIKPKRWAAKTYHQPQHAPEGDAQQQITTGENNPVPATNTMHTAVAEPVNTMANLSHKVIQSTQKSSTSKSGRYADSSLISPTDQQQQMAAMASTAKPNVQAVVPNEIMPEKPAQTEDNTFKTTAGSVPVATSTMAAVDTEKPKRKRHGFHTLGDVVNMVVAKVDKREDKLIEFTDTDGDEAEVTGINLGIFRVKKQK